MESVIRLQLLLFERVCSVFDASEIVNLWIQIHSDECKYGDSIEDFRSFLSVATEHNHTELLKYLTADVLRNFESPFGVNTSPHFFGITVNKLTYYEVFFRTDSVVNFCWKDRKLVVYNGELHYSMTAVEYVCLLDRPEMLEHLLSDYKEKHDTSSYIKNVTILLRTVMRLVKFADQLCDGTRKLSLVKVVQVLIDAGASVHESQNQHFTAFQLFMQELRSVIREDNKITTEGRRMITNILQILLTVKPELTRAKYLPRPFRILMHFMKSYMIYLNIQTTESLITYRCQFSFIIDILKLLLLHDAEQQDKDVDFLLCIMEAAVHLNKCCKSVQRPEGVLARCIKISNLNVVVDLYADVFRCIMLKKINAMTENSFSSTNIFCARFVDAFVSVLKYSSQRSQTKKLMKCVLNSLSASGVFELEKLLTERLALKQKRDGEKPHASTKYALEMVRSIQTPLRLQHLARLSVIGSLSRESMFDSSKLPVPQDVQNYIMFNS